MGIRRLSSLYWIFVLFVIISACSASKKMAEQASDKKEQQAKEVEQEIVTEQLDTLAVVTTEVEEDPNEAYPPPLYRPSYKREIDIVHTKLDLAFDFQKEAVLGKAWLQLCPIYEPVSAFRLDAKYFDIHELRMRQPMGVSYTYEDSVNLWITLEEPIQRGDTVELFVNYTAFPGRGGEGGSAAITSDKGLFFINPRNESPNKPRQIWTQGETEHNSNWFPTVDKPNERCSQELALTVPEEMSTLSNGRLVRQESVGNGMRKDYWRQDLPHAPYLFMIAVGDYSIVDDEWRDKPLHYYVEHDYEPYAAEIFDHTPEMIEFFSTILDYPYPWDKYDQVIVRDFVSGAMENTTGVIFGDFVQKYGLDLPDNDNDFIVAHELFHHWFGDLVTCESWANLTMNEGFANYSEYLWKEYKHGKDLADEHRMNEMQGYLMQARQFTHPLIYFQYAKPEQMFDQHSYNKGGLVLHMLRDYLGDEMFFDGLSLFLKRHEFTAVEAHDLRLAMEDISGEDLNWFFNQWYFEEGHPKLMVTDSYSDGKLTLTIEQTQDPEVFPAIFTLPTEVDVFRKDGTKERFSLDITQRKSIFNFTMEEEPALVIFDPEDILLAVVQHEKPSQAFAYQYQWSNTLAHRVEALKQLVQAPEEVHAPVYLQALEDKHPAIRVQAIQKLSASQRNQRLKMLYAMALNDESPSVRAEALQALCKTDMDIQEKKELCMQVIQKEKAAIEMSAALYEMYTLDTAATIQKAKDLENVKSDILKRTIADIYAETGDVAFIEFFDKMLPKQSGFNSFPFFNAYSKMVGQLPFAEASQRIDRLFQKGSNMNSGMFTRYAATKAIADIRASLDDNPDKEKILPLIQEKIKAIKETETNSRLQAMYSGF